MAPVAESLSKRSTLMCDSLDEVTGKVGRKLLLRTSALNAISRAAVG